MIACFNATSTSGGSILLSALGLVFTTLNPTKRYKTIVITAAFAILCVICSFSSRPATAQISEFAKSSESVMLPNLNWHSADKQFVRNWPPEWLYGSVSTAFCKKGLFLHKIALK